MAIEIMLAGNIQCAYQLLDSESMKAFQTGRINNIKTLLKDFFELYKTVATANRQLIILDRGIKEQQQKLERNKTLINDEFARKAGTQDRSSEINSEIERREKEIKSAETKTWKQIKDFFKRWNSAAQTGKD